MSWFSKVLLIATTDKLPLLYIQNGEIKNMVIVGSNVFVFLLSWPLPIHPQAVFLYCSACKLSTHHYVMENVPHQTSVPAASACILTLSVDSLCVSAII